MMANSVVIKRNKTIEYYTVYILNAVILIIVGSLSEMLTLLSLVICAAYFVYLNLRTTKRKYIPRIIIGLLLFQNLSIGLGAHLGKNTSSYLSIMTQVPTLLIVISYSFVLIKSSLHKIDILFFVLVGICVLFVFVGGGSFVAKFTYFRNFVVFYMAYSVGKKCLTTNKEIDEFLDFYISLSVLAVVFGVVGWVLGKTFYQTMGVLEVYLAKHYSSYINGLPGNFQTVFLGHRVNRLASMYYEPVNFSHFLALSVLLAYVKKKWWLFVLFAVCELLTFGKGGILVLGLTLICFFVQKIFINTNARIVRGLVIIVVLCGVIGLAFVVQTRFKNDFGTYNHFYGIITGIKAIRTNPLGNGLGTAGNLIKTARVRSQEVSETGLINLAYQIGAVGALIFCVVFLSTAVGAFKAFRINKSVLCAYCMYLPIMLLLVSVFQENTYAPQCIVPYMILVGASSNYEKTGNILCCNCVLSNERINSENCIE